MTYVTPAGIPTMVFVSPFLRVTFAEADVFDVTVNAVSPNISAGAVKAMPEEDGAVRAI